MRSKLLEEAPRTWALVFDTGDEVMGPLAEFAREQELSASDFSAIGGHLIEAVVRPTLEVVLTESPAHLRRTKDPETGLALIDLGASDAT